MTILEATTVFQVIKQTKLSTPKNPCISSPEYSYQTCMERKIKSNIGCQPSWLDSTNPTNETCTQKQIRVYLMEMIRASFLGQKSIFMIFGCKKPCEYFEFKVKLITLQLFNLRNDSFFPFRLRDSLC